MKKYLMTGMAALAICAAFTSCSKGTDLYNAEVIQENSVAKIQKDYAEAFVATFGQPAANQDWGFGTTTRAFTRGDGVGEVIKPDNGKDGIFEFTNEEKNNAAVWRSPEGVSKYVAPITDAEREWVQAWFDNPENAGLSEEGRDFKNFYVQQVYNKLYSDAQDNKEGYFWELKNGEIEKDPRNYKVKMDQLRIGSARDEASTVHINDFNATDKGGNVWNAIYVKDGSSKQFGYYASYGSQWQWKFRCVELTVPGSCFGEGEADRKGWYVGLSYYCDKVEVAGQKGEIIGENEIDICNDWILKIVPGDTEEYEDQIRIIAEDLNAKNDPDDNNGDSDWDFNDVVFDVEFTSETTANIHILAAGGVLPIYVAGTEAHSVFGIYAPDADGKYPMINTAEGKHYEYTSEPFPISGIQKSNNGKDIEIKVIKTINGVETPCILTAANGQPASKIGVDPSFEWCNERQKISRKYPLFTQWVQTTEPWRWYGLYE